MKRSLRIPIIIISLALVIAAAALYLYADRIALFLISRECNVTIAYQGLKHASFNRYDFSGFTVTDNTSRIGLSAKEAVIKPIWKEIAAGKLAIDVALSDVAFIKRSGEKTDDYETFEGLAALPLSSQWAYRDIRGILETSNGDIRLRDFVASGDMLRFSVTGDFLKDATINTDITIYFSDRLLEKVPKQFIKGVLKEEGDGWQSFSMKLTGNYKSPSIQVTGKLFRLNIGLASQ